MFSKQSFPYVFGTCSKTPNIYALNNKTYTRDNHSPCLNKLQRKKMCLIRKTRLLWK